MKKWLLLALIAVQASAYELVVTGTVISDNQKMIGARYMGYVKHIFYDIGDRVKREDTLFELESAEFDIMKNQADLALEQAEIMVDMYRSRMDEIRRERILLKTRGFATAEDFRNLDILADNISAGLSAAQAIVENATVKVKQVATISDYLEVKAPNDGIIVEKRIREGDLIVPGMLAMILVDLDHLEIQAEIGESDLRHVERKQRVRVTIPALDYSTFGIVKTVVPSANPMAHTFKVIVRFVKTHPKIYPGMYAKIGIAVND